MRRHTRSTRDLLVGDHPGNGSANFENRGRMIDAAAQHAKTLGGVLHVHLGFVLDFFRGLVIVQRDFTLVVEKLVALELDSPVVYVMQRLAIARKRSV